MSFSKNRIKAAGFAILAALTLSAPRALATEAEDARRIAVYGKDRTTIADGFLAGFEIVSWAQNVLGTPPRGCRYIPQESGVSIGATAPKHLTPADIANGLT